MTDNGQLEHLARRLGAEAAERVDPEATAQAVLRRLRAAPRPVRWWRRPKVLQVAAVVAILVTGGVGVNWLLQNGAMDEFAYGAPVELAELGDGDLAAVLDSLAFEAPVSELVSPGLDGLDETQLRTLLAVMEGG